MKAPPICRLSSVEQEKRNAKGFCFNCNETRFRGHQCKHLLCILTINDDEGTNEIEQDEPSVAVISLQARTGVHMQDDETQCGNCRPIIDSLN